MISPEIQEIGLKLFGAAISLGIMICFFNPDFVRGEIEKIKKWIK